MSEKQAGDIVSITEEGFAFGKVGRVIDFPGDANHRTPIHHRIPVMFPRFLAPRFFGQHDCILATEAERKIYFMDILKNGDKFQFTD